MEWTTRDHAIARCQADDTFVSVSVTFELQPNLRKEFCMLKPLVLLAMIGSVPAAFADTLPTENALVTVTAVGTVTAPNDEAQLVFGYEEQGKDKAALASSVNLRLKQGIAALK